MNLNRLKAIFLFLYILMVANSCSSQAQLNPCDPPPPCLPPFKQYFGFNFVWEREKPATSSVQFLVTPDKTSTKNSAITTQLVANGKIFRVSFLDPQRLEWKSEDSFQAFLDAGKNTIDTLIFKIKIEKIDCCPQITITEAWLDGQAVCSPCYPNKPMKFKKQ